MKAFERPVFAAFLMLGLAACGGADPVADNTESSASLPDAETRPPDEMTGAGDVEAANAVAPGAATVASARIPSALQGRWALNPGDCEAGTPSPSVLVITADELRFHESIARPTGQVDASADFMGGEFRFAGEGESWTRRQSLQLQGGQLVRTQRDPNESFTYVRCED